jgi:hypothetical protein
MSFNVVEASQVFAMIEPSSRNYSLHLIGSYIENKLSKNEVNPNSLQSCWFLLVR